MRVIVWHAEVDTGTAARIRLGLLRCYALSDARRVQEDRALSLKGELGVVEGEVAGGAHAEAGVVDDEPAVIAAAHALWLPIEHDVLCQVRVPRLDGVRRHRVCCAQQCHYLHMHAAARQWRAGRNLGAVRMDCARGAWTLVATRAVVIAGMCSRENPSGPVAVVAKSVVGRLQW